MSDALVKGSEAGASDDDIKDMSKELAQVSVAQLHKTRNKR